LARKKVTVFLGEILFGFAKCSDSRRFMNNTQTKAASANAFAAFIKVQSVY